MAHYRGYTVMEAEAGLKMALAVQKMYQRGFLPDTKVWFSFSNGAHRETAFPEADTPVTIQALFDRVPDGKQKRVRMNFAFQAPDRMYAVIHVKNTLNLKPKQFKWSE